MNNCEPANQFSIETRHRFDPVLWGSVPLLAASASTVLVTWTLVPEPADGGMPPRVQVPFAATLCALGNVFYAADADAARVATRVAEVSVKQGFRQRKLLLFRANSGPAVLPAFESGIHNWSANAQWLIVSSPSDLDPALLEALARTLYQDWRLPNPWPEAVMLIIQAGVDGDAAICHCKDRWVDERFCRALHIAATEANANYHVLDDNDSSN